MFFQRRWIRIATRYTVAAVILTLVGVVELLALGDSPDGGPRFVVVAIGVALALIVWRALPLSPDKRNDALDVHSAIPVIREPLKPISATQGPVSIVQLADDRILFEINRSLSQEVNAILSDLSPAVSKEAHDLHERIKAAEAQVQQLTQQLAESEQSSHKWMIDFGMKCKSLAAAEAAGTALRQLLAEAIYEDCLPNAEYCWWCHADVNGKISEKEPHAAECFYVRALAAVSAPLPSAQPDDMQLLREHLHALLADLPDIEHAWIRERLRDAFAAVSAPPLETP